MQNSSIFFLRILISSCVVFFCLGLFASENSDLAHLDHLEATASLEEVQKKNMYGHEKYSMAAAVLGKQAIIAYGHGSECGVSCPGGCCDDAESLNAEAAMLTMLNFKSNKQAQEHRTSAMQACTAFNQLSSEHKDCKGEISPLDQFTPQPSWYDDDGACKSSAAPECKMMDQFDFNTSFKKQTPLYKCGSTNDRNCNNPKLFFEAIKLNADGSVDYKMKNGSKKITLEMMVDPKKMKELGFSDKTIRQIATVTSSKVGQVFNQFKIDPRGITPRGLNSKSRNGSGGQDDISERANNLNSSPSSSTDIDLKMNKKLFKQMNGDPIGMSDADIFLMIQNRYNSEFN